MPPFKDQQMNAPITKTRETVSNKIKKPKRYCVVIYNDDVTPMQFVVDLLMNVFKHSHDQAQKLMMQIHTDNSAVAGTYSYEIAEQKAVDSTVLARNAGYPLIVKLTESE
jgi:ATP-dependent Clp protease adaptor protein ClpS